MARIVVGALLAFVTTAALRRLVGAPLAGVPGRRRLLPLVLDASPGAIGFALFLIGSARPVLAGLGVAALGVGLGVADRVKRAVLDEPVVFADRAELLDVVRHPRFYIAFVGWWRMIGGALACATLVAALVWAEPPLWHVPFAWQALLALAAALIGRACFVVPTWPPLLGRLAARYAGLEPSRDPARDMPRFGLLATCIVHATLARAERPGRQRAAQAAALPAFGRGAGPVVLVQAESFLDVGRLDPAARASLPHFGRLSAEAALAGRLEVPCWGANTIRTELEVVSGIGVEALGLDRFNPYEAFARVPLPSLAHAARAAGWRTVCVHPYSRTFYGRHRVMPLLGFDRLIGIEAFGDAERDGGYVTDRALADFVAGLVRDEGPDLFVFAISVENHGPWNGAHDPVAPAPLPAAWRAWPDAAEIGRWLRHAQATDAMIPILRDALTQAGGGWLAFYGDHQPSLAGLLAAAGGDRRTDYAFWTPGGPAGGTPEGEGGRTPLAAHGLPAALLRLASAGGRL